jgi:Flp pilus assembly protein TadG
MQKKLLSRQRPHEQGQTMVLVAISLVSLLAMAALAIDIVTLYAARSEVQRAADAAALAGAKAIADSGITTLLTTDPQFTTVQPWAITAATAQINGVIQNNLVAGVAPSLVAGSPSFTWAQGNPQVTVKLSSSNLPTFFSKIWGGTTPVATATATAEVYNPANLPNFIPIVPKAVKPWLVANIDPNTINTPFIDAAGNVEAGVIGEVLNLTADCGPPATSCAPTDNPPGKGPANNSPPNYLQVEYVPALVTAPSSPNPNVCPPCAGATDYEQSIECADVSTSYQVLSCGGGASTAKWDNTIYPGGLGGLSDLGTECLIHATGTGKKKGQDELDSLPWPSNPMKITGGSGSAQNGNLVTTSNSIVTIPILDRAAPLLPSGPVTIDGYIQAFINEVHGPGNPAHRGDIEITVLNIAGCNSTSTNLAVNPVVGGSGTSPVPVRLIGP